MEFPEWSLWLILCVTVVAAIAFYYWGKSPKRGWNVDPAYVPEEVVATRADIINFYKWVARFQPVWINEVRNDNLFSWAESYAAEKWLMDREYIEIVEDFGLTLTGDAPEYDRLRQDIAEMMLSQIVEEQS